MKSPAKSLDYLRCLGIFNTMKSIDSLSLNNLQNVLRSIRKNSPAAAFPHDLAASSDIRTGYLDGIPVRRLVITLRAPGCSWVSRSGGCTMCGHYAGTTQGVLPSSYDSVAQFTSEIAKYDINGIEVISLYNSGFHISRLHKLLSAGTLGIGKNRRLYHHVQNAAVFCQTPGFMAHDDFFFNQTLDVFADVLFELLGNIGDSFTLQFIEGPAKGFGERRIEEGNKSLHIEYDN